MSYFDPNKFDAASSNDRSTPQGATPRSRAARYPTTPGKNPKARPQSTVISTVQRKTRRPKELSLLALPTATRPTCSSGKESETQKSFPPSSKGVVRALGNSHDADHTPPETSPAAVHPLHIKDPNCTPVQQPPNIRLSYESSSPSVFHSGSFAGQSFFVSPTYNRTGRHTLRPSDSVTSIPQGTLTTSRYYTEFTEVRELGRGEFGRVCCVSRQKDGELFAVKTVDLGPAPSSRELVRRDVEVLSQYRVSRCPRVVCLHSSWREGSTIFLQLEYCPGGTLWDLVQGERRGHLAENYVRCVLADIVIALHTCHTSSVAHGDVKLENILIDSQGMHRLADFGMSVFLNKFGFPKPTSNLSPSTAWSQEEGDVRYLASDMLNEKTHYKAADVFALGMSLYELMRGAPLPTSGEEYQRLRNDQAPRIPRYSEELNSLVHSLMARDPIARPTTYDILRHNVLSLPREGLAPRADAQDVRLRQSLLLCEYQRLEDLRRQAEVESIQ